MTNSALSTTPDATQCLVIGMSHIDAIRRGIPKGYEECIAFVNLNNQPEVHDRERNTINLEKIPETEGQTVFLSIGGNFYNVFGLVDNPVPFFVHGTLALDETTDRQLIPREMMLDHFRVRLERFNKNLRVLKEHFSNSQIFHICSPPPIESSDHIRKYPCSFAQEIEMGVAPAALRRNLYDIQTAVYEEFCSALSINFIDPPIVSLTETGFLKEDYFSIDPTHANAKYGTLVWNQMNEIIHA